MPIASPDFYIYDSAGAKVAMCFRGTDTKTEAVFLVKALNGSTEPVLLNPGRYFAGAPIGQNFPEEIFGPNVAALEFPVEKQLVMQVLGFPIEEVAKNPKGKP